ALLLALLLEDKDPLLVRHDDVGQLIAVEIVDDELRANAGVVVDFVWREGRYAVSVFLGLEPIEHRRLVRTGLAAAVRPPALAGDEVLEAVAVDVHEMEG